MRRKRREKRLFSLDFLFEAPGLRNDHLARFIDKQRNQFKFE